MKKRHKKIKIQKETMKLFALLGFIALAVYLHWGLGIIMLGIALALLF